MWPDVPIGNIAEPLMTVEHYKLNEVKGGGGHRRDGVEALGDEPYLTFSDLWPGWKLHL